MIIQSKGSFKQTADGGIDTPISIITLFIAFSESCARYGTHNVYFEKYTRRTISEGSRLHVSVKASCCLYAGGFDTTMLVTPDYVSVQCLFISVPSVRIKEHEALPSSMLLSTSRWEVRQAGEQAQHTKLALQTYPATCHRLASSSASHSDSDSHYTRCNPNRAAFYGGQPLRPDPRVCCVTAAYTSCM